MYRTNFQVQLDSVIKVGILCDTLLFIGNLSDCIYTIFTDFI